MRPSQALVAAWVASLMTYHLPHWPMLAAMLAGLLAAWAAHRLGLWLAT